MAPGCHNNYEFHNYPGYEIHNNYEFHTKFLVQQYWCNSIGATVLVQPGAYEYYFMLEMVDSYNSSGKVFIDLKGEEGI